MTSRKGEGASGAAIVLALFALAGCVQNRGDKGVCTLRASGERFAATPLYDVDGIRYWTVRDANGLEQIVDRDNSREWSCAISRKPSALQHRPSEGKGSANAN